MDWRCSGAENGGPSGADCSNGVFVCLCDSPVHGRAADALLTQCLLPSRIIRFPWQLVKAKVRRTIEEALKVWSDVTPLTFTEVQEGRADIVIDFTRWAPSSSRGEAGL